MVQVAILRYEVFDQTAYGHYDEENKGFFGFTALRTGSGFDTCIFLMRFSIPVWRC
jgi:hypothetical protein